MNVVWREKGGVGERKVEREESDGMMVSLQSKGPVRTCERAAVDSNLLLLLLTAEVNTHPPTHTLPVRIPCS